MLESLNRILFHEDDLLKVSTVKSSSWILQSDVEYFNCFSFRYVKQIVGEGFEVLVLILWMYEVKHLSLLGLPLLFSAELYKSAGAEPMEGCASAETQSHRQIPAARICKYDTLLTILSGTVHSSTVKLFIQALWCVSCYAASPACCPFCVTTAVVLLWLPTPPVFEEVWFWVLLNCIGYLGHLPCAVPTPTPALNSVWSFAP